MNAKKTENTALTTVKAAGLPVGYEYDDAEMGAGFENLTSDDFKIPFFNLLQSLSDPVKACRDGSVREGMLYNTVTQVAYPADMKEKEKGILFVPCYVIHNFIEWKSRKFVGVHPPHDAFVKDIVANAESFGKNKTPDGNDLVETYSVYGVFIDEDALVVDGVMDWDTTTIEQCVIPHASTKINAIKGVLSRKRLMRIPGTTKTFPMYSHVWRIQTVPQSHADGDSYNIQWSLAFGNAKTGAVESLIPTSSLIYQVAKEFYSLCSAGGVAEATEKGLKQQSADHAEANKNRNGAEDVLDDGDEAPF